MDLYFAEPSDKSKLGCKAQGIGDIRWGSLIALTKAVDRQRYYLGEAGDRFRRPGGVARGRPRERGHPFRAGHPRAGGVACA